MIDPTRSVRLASQAESIATFEWRGLRLHVVTADPLQPDQVRTIRKALAKVGSVGQFADVLGMVLGRHIRIRTERPSPDIRLEVGR